MENVLIVERSETGATVAAPLYQYDYGQVIELRGFEDYPNVIEAHFAARGSEKSVTSIGSRSEIAIPDVCLKAGEPVDVWIFCHTGEEDGETVYRIVIPVIRRAQPDDEKPPPEQQSAITQAIAALTAGTERAEAAADASEASADRADEAAQTAQQAAEAAAVLLELIATDEEAAEATAALLDGHDSGAA